MKARCFPVRRPPRRLDIPQRDRGADGAAEPMGPPAGRRNSRGRFANTLPYKFTNEATSPTNTRTKESSYSQSFREFNANFERTSPFTEMGLFQVFVWEKLFFFKKLITSSPYTRLFRILFKTSHCTLYFFYGNPSPIVQRNHGAP